MAPIDMSANVRTPAIWPLRLRSKPTQHPSMRLRHSLKIDDTTLTSIELTESYMVVNRLISVDIVVYLRKVKRRDISRKLSANSSTV